MSQNQVTANSLLDLYCEKNGKKRSKLTQADKHNAILFGYNYGGGKGFQSGVNSALEAVKRGDIYLEEGEWKYKQKEGVEMNPIETVSEK